MKYAVTFCAMDSDVGGNPFWHSCLLLSVLDEDTGKMEVIDNWGFYGVPTTMGDSLLRRVKIKLGLDVDLYGNHGMLKHEDLRYLDRGKGLHGVTFELTKNKFEQLKARCEKMEKDQRDAIDEIIKPTGLKGKPANKTRIYPHEDLSYHIFALEKAKAKQENRDPRLKPFEFNLSMTMWGPSFNDSFTCKTQAVNLLDGILTSMQIKRITQNKNHLAVPRYSGQLETISLHSSGPIKVHTTRKGNKIYYRDSEDNDVKLHWTLPPQEIETLTGQTKRLFELHDDHVDEARKIVGRLQDLEWLLMNVDVEEKHLAYKQALVLQCRTLYQSFSTIRPKIAESTVEGWQGYFYSLVSWPRDIDEAHLMKRINQSKAFFNTLYMAIVDEWQIYDDCKAEMDIPEDESLLNDNDYFNPMEALLNYVPVEVQKKVCSIINRNYVAPEESCTIL
jgi:hypothetical protein